MRAISLVEKGWAGARWLSIILAKEGTPVHHLVKGRLPNQVLRIITPYPRITLHGIPPKAHRVAAFLILALGQVPGTVGMVIVDNSKTAQWVARWFPVLRDRIVLVGETETGKPQIHQKGPRIALPFSEASV